MSDLRSYEVGTVVGDNLYMVWERGDFLHPDSAPKGRRRVLSCYWRGMISLEGSQVGKNKLKGLPLAGVSGLPTIVLALC